MIVKFIEPGRLYAGQYGFDTLVNDCTLGSSLIAKDRYQSFIMSARVALLIVLELVLCRKGLVAPWSSVPALNRSLYDGRPQSETAEAM